MVATPRCARPGCGAAATAWLSYDYSGQRVWLDDAAAESAGHRCALCSAHAGRLRPPRGWLFTDRRTQHRAPPLPPLVKTAPAAPISAVVPRSAVEAESAANRSPADTADHREQVAPAEPSAAKAQPVAV